MKPRTAGTRVILLSIPFLGFGLLWALWPPLEDRIGEDVLVLLRTLGVAMALVGFAAIGLGIWLILREDQRIL